MSIISFIYKGEINIEQQHLPALLKAAATLQIRGLSDSVSTIDTELLSDKNERPTKKRKFSEQQILPEAIAEENLLHTEQDLVPKEEPICDDLINSDFIGTASDEEDIKDGNLVNENPQSLLPTDSGGNTGKYYSFTKIIK